MNDASGPTPSMSASTVCAQRNRTSLIVVTLTAGLGATLFMSGLAHAEPMMSRAGMLSGQSLLHAAGSGDERALFGLLTLGFSLVAAGVWHRSFKAIRKSEQDNRH